MTRASYIKEAAHPFPPCPAFRGTVATAAMAATAAMLAAPLPVAGLRAGSRVARRLARYLTTVQPNGGSSLPGVRRLARGGRGHAGEARGAGHHRHAGRAAAGDWISWNATCRRSGTTRRGWTRIRFRWIGAGTQARTLRGRLAELQEGISASGGEHGSGQLAPPMPRGRSRTPMFVAFGPHDDRRVRRRVVWDALTPRFVGEGGRGATIVVNLAHAVSYGHSTDERFIGVLSVVAHEVFHAAFGAYKDASPAWRQYYASNTTPFDAMLDLAQNEGIAYYLSLRSSARGAGCRRNGSSASGRRSNSSTGMPRSCSHRISRAAGAGDPAARQHRRVLRELWDRWRER